MDQRNAAIGTYKEMRKLNLIPGNLDINQIKEIRNYFERLYAMGFDEGARQGSHNKLVAQFDMGGKFIRTFESVTTAARSVKRNKSAVAKAAKGETEYSGGYRWAYVDEDWIETHKDLKNGTSENSR
jgi:hypothetical protein